VEIQAVVFDWGGVLAGDVSTGFAEVEERLGLPPGSMPGIVGMHPCETQAENLWHLRELGRATAAEWAQWYCDRVVAAGGPAIPPGVLVESERARFAALPVNEPVLEVVHSLHDSGYRLAVCTNNFTEVGDAWRTALPMELFDAVVVSCEVGLRKPDPAMYACVTDQLGVPPAATVLLDDLPGNVDGATAVGWHGILVGADRGAALRELTALLPV
jgi:putative hydrolase of the HAD superfamily